MAGRVQGGRGWFKVGATVSTAILVAVIFSTPAARSLWAKDRVEAPREQRVSAFCQDLKDTVSPLVESFRLHSYRVVGNGLALSADNVLNAFLVAWPGKKYVASQRRMMGYVDDLNCID